MASSEAEICNLALLRIGNRSFIGALNTDSVEAEACSVAYPTSRDALLQAADWSFARRRALLAELADAEVDGYAYVYALPTDCLAPRSIYPGVRNPGQGQKIAFTTEHDATTGKEVLATDEFEAKLVYTAKITTVARFHPLFVEALAWKLAQELAFGLPVKAQLAMGLNQNFRVALAMASAAVGNQSEGDPSPDSATIRER